MIFKTLHFLVNLETGILEDKRKSFRPKNLFTEDEHFLEVMFLRNNKKIQQRVDTGTESEMFSVEGSLRILRKGNSEKSLRSNGVINPNF